MRRIDQETFGEAPDDLHDRPMSELLRRLADKTAQLIRQEMQLARTEMVSKAREAGAGAGLFGGAGLVGLGAFAALTAAIILALVGSGLAPWAAALIVAVVYAIVAGILGLTGKKKFERAAPPIPQETIDSVKETVQWAKTRTKSDGI